MNRGVIMAAYGDNAIAQALAGIDCLRRSNPGLAVCVMTDNTKAFRYSGAKQVCRVDSDKFGRGAKLSSDKISPFDLTLYLDADTRVRASIDFLFQLLSDGWEFVLTLSAQQSESGWLWQVPVIEREQIIEGVGFQPAQAQGGVWGFRKTERVGRFFALWRDYFRESDGEHDQGAMQRALTAQPMQSYIVSRHWNGGPVINHEFGRARRND